GDDKTHDQREDIGALVGELERPADSEFLQIGGRYRSEICKIAGDPAGISDPERRSEGERKFFDVALEGYGRRAQDGKKSKVSRDKGAEAAKPGIGFGNSAEGLAYIAPHRRGDEPAEQIDIGDAGERQDENEKPDDQRQPVLADAWRNLDIVGARGGCFIPCGCRRHEQMPLHQRMFGKTPMTISATNAVASAKAQVSSPEICSDLCVTLRIDPDSKTSPAVVI